MPQTQYQEYQPIQPVDAASTSPSFPDQNIQQQASPPVSDTPTGTSEGFGVQSDMYRRTGGQGRGTAPGQAVQQMPPSAQGVQQAPPVQQDPQAMQQAMPQQQPMMQQPMITAAGAARNDRDVHDTGEPEQVKRCTA